LIKDRHPMNRLFLSIAVLGIAGLFPPHTHAQTPKKIKATLTGTVIGIDGKPVPHAAVSCQSSGGIAPHAVHTDAKGRFIITGLKQDSYDLRASAKGANSEWHRNIPLKRGQTKDVTLQLELSTEPPATMPLKQPDAQLPQ
jgi:Carboxypeptidase regulatory-like domain